MSMELNDSRSQASQNQQVDHEHLLADTAPIARKLVAQTAGDTSQAAATGAACPESPLYLKMMDRFFQYGYDREPAADRQKMAHVYDCDISNAPTGTKLETAREKANKAIFDATHDHYNTILSTKDWSDMQAHTSGKFGGLGMEVSNSVLDDKGSAKHPKTVDEAKALEGDTTSPRGVEVRGLLKGTPAQNAGVQEGDVIKTVNGKDESGKPLNDVVNDLRGDPGDPVNLTVVRNGKEVNFPKIVRDVIHPQSVSDPEYRGANKDIAYIKVKDFTQVTTDQLETAMRDSPNAKAYVIDFRNDPGGLLDEAITSSQLFLDKGTLMFETERDQGDPGHPTYTQKEWVLTPRAYRIDQSTLRNPDDTPDPDKVMRGWSYGRRPNLANGKPVEFLINGGTASAAEIVVGAVHDHNAAELVGEQSFGKGIVQTIMPGPGTMGTRVTSGHYFSPNKHWPGDAADKRYGYEPDVKVPTPDVLKWGVEKYGSAADEQLNVAVQRAEDKIKAQSKTP